MKRLKELLKKTTNIEIINNKNIDININKIEYDSRKLEKDDIFFALRGEKFDGHNFIDQAIEKGISAIVCEEFPKEINDDVVYILVENSRKSLAEFAHKCYDEPSKSMKVIGITGTNGKTTITFLLKNLFDAADYKTAIIGTTGIYIGLEMIPATHTTPESLEIAKLMSDMREKEVEICIMEVSSHALHQHRADFIDFDCGIFTNLTLDHLDYHKTMENYAAAKKILFDMLGENAFAIVNNDSEYADYMVKDVKNAIKVGRNFDSDIIIKNEVLSIDAIRFELNEISYEISLPGKFNIDNTALAITCAEKLGLDSYVIKNSIKKASGAPGRMQRIGLLNGAAGIIDYAHTPDALEKALYACREILENSNDKGKLICVFGCGGDRDNSKRPIMGKHASEIADIPIITNDNPRTEEPDKIIEDILTGIEDKRKCVIIKDRREAINKAYELSNAGDLILIAGKGHEKYQIIGTERHHFDDVEEISYFI